MLNGSHPCPCPSKSRFKNCPQAKAIEVFAVAKSFREDTADTKVNLSVGAYRDDDCQPWILPVVKKVESAMPNDPKINHEYLPVLGLPSLVEHGVKLVLGENSPAVLQNRAIGLQTLSGTGGLRVGAEFLKRFGGVEKVLNSNPTWGNHNMIFADCGYKVGAYRYWDPSKKCLDFSGMIEDLEKAEDGCVVVLHGCCHNPTGVDPTMDQWKEILRVMVKKKHFPFFDCAYLGFASGDVDVDSQAVRLFASAGQEMLVAQSFAKNFGLYNERAGCLAVVTSDSSLKPIIESQLELIVRAMYSNPPQHGAKIVATILEDPSLKLQWKDNVKTIADRVLLMRKMLFQKLTEMGTPGTWNHVIDQKGMFCFTGLSSAQVKVLTEEFHIYLLSNGRVNMAGLSTKNVDYVAKAIHKVCS